MQYNYENPLFDTFSPQIIPSKDNIVLFYYILEKIPQEKTIISFPLEQNIVSGTHLRLGEVH